MVPVEVGVELGVVVVVGMVLPFGPLTGCVLPVSSTGGIVPLRRWPTASVTFVSSTARSP